MDFDVYDGLSCREKTSKTVAKIDNKHKEVIYEYIS